MNGYVNQSHQMCWNRLLQSWKSGYWLRSLGRNLLLPLIPQDAQEELCAPSHLVGNIGEPDGLERGKTLRIADHVESAVSNQ
eukprot:CAMPEP_0185765200 /NCGR_PEP_ID=MMETSP1174-20130828/27134_1 /TAXON_ID=35687 /ORGANISM="Dictyocha speculum, Strain CCMP1381" /LENGTH=81 /DNA_ID=CAMNT_0028448175 /DNA_START=200 /DNA_END=445 /DNA_ORIENTATION=-